MAVSTPFPSVRHPGSAVLPDGWDLTEIIRRLKQVGVEISFDQEVRAHLLFARLQDSGVSLTRGAAIDWLAASLCTSREASTLLRATLTPPEDRPTGGGVVENIKTVARLADRARLLRIFVIVVGIGLAGISFLVDLRDLTFFDVPDPKVIGPEVGDPGEGGEPIPIDPPIGIVEPEDIPALRLLNTLYNDVIMRLYAILPFALAAWLVIAGKGARRASMRRHTGLGERFADIPIPRAEMARGRVPHLRKALDRFRAPRLEIGGRLDLRRTIREAVRRPGLPDLHFLNERRNNEYLILSEGRAAASHRRLLLDRLLHRLELSDTSFAQYELGASLELAAFAAGKRDGARVEPLSVVMRRYSGARLVLFGTAAEILRRGRYAGAGVSLAAMHAEFPLIIAFLTIPQGRWGRDEQELALSGVRIFEASDAGFIKAGAILEALQNRRDVSGRAMLSRANDAFLSAMRLNAGRYMSNAEPDAREIGVLVRQVNGFLGNSDAIRLFAALAAVPRFNRDMTLFLAKRINSRPLDDEAALRLACLPWMEGNRMPDWFRLAVLRALPSAERQDLRERMTLIFAELLGEVKGPLSDTTLQVLKDLGGDNELVGRIDAVAREGVFLRFLRDEPLDELDLDLGEIRARPSNLRVAAGLGFLVIGALLSEISIRGASSLSVALDDAMLGSDGPLLPAFLLVLALSYCVGVARMRCATTSIELERWALRGTGLVLYPAAYTFVSIFNERNASIEAVQHFPDLLVGATLPLIVFVVHVVWDQAEERSRPLRVDDPGILSRATLCLLLLYLVALALGAPAALIPPSQGWSNGSFSNSVFPILGFCMLAAVMSLLTVNPAHPASLEALQSSPWRVFADALAAASLVGSGIAVTPLNVRTLVDLIGIPFEPMNDIRIIGFSISGALMVLALLAARQVWPMAIILFLLNLLALTFPTPMYVSIAEFLSVSLGHAALLGIAAQVVVAYVIALLLARMRRSSVARLAHAVGRFRNRGFDQYRKRAAREEGQRRDDTASSTSDDFASETDGRAGRS